MKTQKKKINLRVAPETPDQKSRRMAWWTEARFGLFIHWGLYSLSSRDWNVKLREGISDEQYQRYFDRFDPIFTTCASGREWLARPV